MNYNQRCAAYFCNANWFKSSTDVQLNNFDYYEILLDMTLPE